MTTKELYEKEQALHISNAMRCFKADPTATDDDKNYDKTEEYLNEMMNHPNGKSWLHNMICALETYLEK